jgi:hypothetical protein
MTIDGRVKVVIQKGKSIPKQVFVDDHEVGGVASVDVSYRVGMARTVILTIYASEVIEVEPDER